MNKNHSRENLFKIRYYPLSLSVLLLLLIAWAALHVGVDLPLQKQQRTYLEHWQQGRKNVRHLQELAELQKEMNRFRALLPVRGDLPQIVSVLSTLAKKHQLAVPEITYQSEGVKDRKLRKMVISFGVRGSYDHIRTFIRAIEVAEYFFIIEDLDLLKSGTKTTDPLLLQLQVAVYLKDPNHKTT